MHQSIKHLQRNDSLLNPRFQKNNKKIRVALNSCTINGKKTLQKEKTKPTNIQSTQDLSYKKGTRTREDTARNTEFPLRCAHMP